MRIHCADRKALSSCARGWKRYGVLGASCVVRNAGCPGVARPIVLLKTGVLGDVEYLGEFSSFGEASEYAELANRFLGVEFDKA